MAHVNTPQLTPGNPGALAIGNHVGEKDPRGTYGENQSEPTNMFGERAQPAWQSNSRETGGGAGQYPANQFPVPSEFYVPKVQVDERFGVLHQQQIDDEIKIVGLNTLAHHIGSDLKPGAGLPDQAALDAMNPIAPQVPESQVRRQRFERQLIALDQFAENYERTLLELRAIDPHHFDTHYSHLYKTNLPRSTPDTSISAGFTTFQAALAKVGIQAQPSTVKSFDPQSFTAPTSDEQKLLPWNEGGYVGMSRELAESCGVPWIEVQKAELIARAPAAPRAKPSLSPNAPKAWKESK